MSDITTSLTRLKSLPHLSAKYASAFILLFGAVWLSAFYGTKLGLLFLIGGGLGVALYHASFGFTAAWRAFIVDGRGRGLRVQMLMLAIGVLLFFPLLSHGSFFDTALRGSVSPLSTGVLIGAFTFGIGMQLGGGCASGTLFTVGGGNMRMIVTLVFFIIGSLLGTINFDWWASLPSLQPVSLVSSFGAFAGIIISLILFAAITALTIIIEKKRHGALEQENLPAKGGFARLLRGPWPMVWGALALVIFNFLTLIIAGRPWGITAAFALWGAKASQFIGITPSDWAYWQTPGNAHALSSSIFSDITSVMNFGIIAGAMLAATLAGKFAPSLKIPPRALLAAIIGGLLMGYGARIAYGCNIGAYFSGVLSGSLHAWLWVFAAFIGSIVGIKMRPLFYK